MNMHTSISHTESFSKDRSGLHFFTEETGAESERCGPDLTKAEPIDQVIRRLQRLRSSFSVAFYQACRESGIDLTVMVSQLGEERLYMGSALDHQAKLRKNRSDRLGKLVVSTKRRRDDVVDLVNMLGRFADNRPFDSIEEAANAFIAAGGRIYVLPDGRCEEIMPYRPSIVMEDSWEGYPRRRMAQRYAATLLRTGAREEMATIVRERGIFRKGSYVLELPRDEA